MTEGNRKLEDTDRHVWEDWAAEVKPLRRRPRVVAQRPPPEARARMREADAAAVLRDAMQAPVDPADWETGDETSFRRDHVPPATLRRLRRGQYAIQGDIDLHGLDRRQAHQALSEFLTDAQRHGWRCVKIIHGKGLRSPQGRPVLKSRVEISLRRHEDVLAYTSAPAWAGGHGAVLALLRRR